MVAGAGCCCKVLGGARGWLLVLGGDGGWLLVLSATQQCWVVLGSAGCCCKVLGGAGGCLLVVLGAAGGTGCPCWQWSWCRPCCICLQCCSAIIE